MSNVSDPEDPDALADDAVESMPDDVEVPEADALEQRRTLGATPTGATELPDMVDPADALDQARVVEMSDDEDLRDPM